LVDTLNVSLWMAKIAIPRRLKLESTEAAVRKAPPNKTVAVKVAHALAATAETVKAPSFRAY
jgi:hypothetical protein